MVTRSPRLSASKTPRDVTSRPLNRTRECQSRSRQLVRHELAGLPGPSGFRSRRLSRSRRASSTSRHHSPVRDLSWRWRFKNAKNDSDGDGDDSASGWTSVEVIPRPWDEKQKKTIPFEQAEGCVRTRDVSPDPTRYGQGGEDDRRCET